MRHEHPGYPVECSRSAVESGGHARRSNRVCGNPPQAARPWLERHPGPRRGVSVAGRRQGSGGFDDVEDVLPRRHHLRAVQELRR